MRGGKFNKFHAWTATEQAEHEALTQLAVVALAAGWPALASPKALVRAFGARVVGWTTGAACCGVAGVLSDWEWWAITPAKMIAQSANPPTHLKMPNWYSRWEDVRPKITDRFGIKNSARASGGRTVSYCDGWILPAVKSGVDCFMKSVMFALFGAPKLRAAGVL
jgi:hypothetical protein